MTCKACGLEHPGWMTCREAKAKYGKIIEEPVVSTVPEKAKFLETAPCPVCEARRLKNLEAVRKYRRKT